jgi:hypothetical protein
VKSLHFSEASPGAQVALMLVMRQIWPTTFFLLAFLFKWHVCFAGALNIQGGMSSLTSGRYVPAVAATLETKNWALSLTSVGVQTPVYYHNSQTLAYYWTYTPGEFLWGDLYAGVGLGIGTSSRGYREAPGLQFDVKSETYIGPALRMSWRILNPLTLNIEAVYGLGPCSHIPPPLTHDFVTVSLGWRL